MSENLLNIPKIDALIEKIGSTRVAEGMAREVLVWDVEMFIELFELPANSGFNTLLTKIVIMMGDDNSVGVRFCFFFWRI